MEFITSDLRIAVENFYIGRIYTITFKDSTSITRACIGKGADYVMFQDTAPKMLFTLNMQTAATVDTIEPGTGSGTYDYDDLENKPQINSVTLSGNKSSSDLGLQDAISLEDPLPANYVSGLATVATTGAYSDLSGLPTLGSAAAADASDFATAAQGIKADATYSAISTAAIGYVSLDARLDSMDTIISGKQAALTESQLDAVNSGIDSTKVAQIETNKNNISTVETDTTLLKNTITTIRFSQGVTRTITFPRPNYNMFVVFGFVQGVGLVHWDCRSSNDGVLSVRDVLTGNSVTQSTITYTRDMDANTATVTISSDVAQWSYLTIIKNADIT